MSVNYRRPLLLAFAFRSIALLTAAMLMPGRTYACTIFSGVAENGDVWNGNNEDGPFGAATYINVYPKGPSARYGFYSLSYDTPANGANANIQGGMNEAGLTFDFNALERSY